MDVLRDNWRAILEAFGVTVEMSVAGAIIAFIVGSVMAALRVGPIPLGRATGTAYVYTVRNTPLLVIMTLFAFGLPQLDIRPDFTIGHHALTNFNTFFVFATAALGLYTAAFVCEALRSGINAIPLGQAEAARSIGMTFGQSLRHVILPQSFRTVIPPLASTMIAMAKNTSIAAVVGVTEATFLMRKLTNDNATALYALFIGFALGYMVLVGFIAFVANLLERKVRIA
jgi:glutamate transport system permease protein